MMKLFKLVNKRATMPILSLVLLGAFLILGFLFSYKYDGLPLARQGITRMSYLKDYLNALFFLVVGTLAILSYLQARKTLFTPIKTEVFKLQLKVFEELLLFFQNKTEMGFVEAFDFPKIVFLNASVLMDEYVTRFFRKSLKFDSEAQRSKYKEFVGGLVSREFAEKHFVIVDYDTDIPEKHDEEMIENPAVILAQWNKHGHGFVQYTAPYVTEDEKLTQFIASPLMPNELRKLLKEFQKSVHDNLGKVGTVLTKYAKELPEKYPNIESLKKVDLSWFWTEYNRERNRFQDQADRILTYINEYLQVEQIIK